jgi:hypothetical protein
VSLLAAGGRAAEADLPPDEPPAPITLPDDTGEALPTGRVDLEIVWFDPHGLMRHGVDRLADDVRAVFRTIGVEVAFSRGGLYGDGLVPQVPVILLPEDTVPNRPGPPVMGLVRRDDSPSRAVWVFHDAVRRVLRQPRRARGDTAPSPWDGAFARAVARVVAHEVVHAVAPDEPHADTGLMRHALGRELLLAKRAPLDPRCASVFVTELRREALRREMRRRAGAPAGVGGEF